MKAGVVAGALVLVLAAEQAGAHSTRKQCQRACGGLITACATRNEDLGDFRRACRAVVLKRCKREGDDVCGATTTSTIPAETSTTTTSTTISSTPTTSTTTTTLRFVDHGNGTVTDRSTGLMWEKKENLDGVANANNPRDADNRYDWVTAMGEWLSDLNRRSDAVSPKTPGFAGHSDWRLPNIDELQTILLAPDPCGTDPCIDPIFGPIVTAFHLSSTTVAADPAQIWKVDFFNGHVSSGLKTFPLYVRAVRGGS